MRPTSTQPLSIRHLLTGLLLILAAAQAPLLHLWSGSTLAADAVVVGPPTADGGALSPVGDGHIDAGDAWLAQAAEAGVVELSGGPAPSAVAQLLAAIRDVRTRDDAEARRARDLEAKAVRFLAGAGLYDARFVRALSGTRLGGRLQIAAVREPAQHAST